MALDVESIRNVPSPSNRVEYVLTGKERPILLKKSAMVSAAKKYASEIEIFTFGSGLQTQISRSSVQKRRFHRSTIMQFWMTDFFNRIGQKQSVNRLVANR